MQEKSALVNVLATFSNQDVFNVCNEFLQVLSAESGSTVAAPVLTLLSSEECFLKFVFIISVYLLKPLQISTLFSNFSSQRISVYSYWLSLDAVMTRSNLYELLVQGTNAKNELLQIIQHVPMTHFHDLPGICGSLVLLAAAKLPVVESRFKLNTLPQSLNSSPSFFKIFTDRLAASHNVALYWKSFTDCLYDDAEWQKYLPLPLRNVLMIELVYSQLRIIFQEQTRLLSNDLQVKDGSKTAERNIAHLLKQLFNNLQQYCDYLQQLQQNPETRMSLIMVPGKLLENFGFLINSSNLAIPTAYHSNLLSKASIPRTSYIILIHAALLFSLNNYYQQKISIQEEEDRTPLNLSSNNYLQEIFTLVSFAFQTEITPSITMLWTFAQSYFLTENDQMRLKMFQILLQCNEKILTELKLRQRFHQKQQSVTLAMNSKRRTTKSQSKEIIPIELFLDYNDTYEVEFNHNLKALSFIPSVITKPYLVVATIAEIVIFYHNFDGSLHDFYQSEPSSSFSSISPAAAAAGGSEAGEASHSSKRSGFSELHEAIELLISSIKTYYPHAIINSLLEIFFHTYVLIYFPPLLLGQTKRIHPEYPAVASKTDLDRMLGDLSLRGLFFGQDILKPDSIITPRQELEREDESDNEDFRIHSDDEGNEDFNSEEDDIFRRGSRKVSYSKEFPNFPVRIHNEIDSLKEECISQLKQHLVGFIVLLIQLGRLFHQYSSITNHLTASYAHRRVYLQISLNIFQFLTELLERVLEDESLVQEYFPSSSASNLIMTSPMDRIILLENFYVLQMQVVFYHGLLLAELQAPITTTVELFKQILSSKELQQQLSKIIIREDISGQINYWQIYEKKLLHVLVLLITNPRYLSGTSSEKPDIYALAASLLNRILVNTNDTNAEVGSNLPSRKKIAQGLRSPENEDEYDLSVNYSLMILQYYAGERKVTLLKCEELMKEIYHRMNQYTLSSSETKSRPPSAPASLLPIVTELSSCDRHRTRQRQRERHLLVKYLLNISFICFRLGKYAYVKLNLVEAWKFLHSVPHKVQQRLQNLTENLATVSENEIIDLMRCIPIPAGEQLNLAGGFGVKHYSELEAEIFYYTGLLLQHDGSTQPVNKTNGDSAVLPHQVVSEEAYRYYQVALQIDPHHIKSLIAMVNLYIERFHREMKFVMKEYSLNHGNQKVDEHEPILGDESIRIFESVENEEEPDNDRNFDHNNTLSKRQRTSRSDKRKIYESKLVEEAFKSSNLASASYYLQIAYSLNPHHPDIW